MATQDLTSAAREVVDAFNAADWERCKAILTKTPYTTRWAHLAVLRVTTRSFPPSKHGVKRCQT